jgi:hypothetical protein
MGSFHYRSFTDEFLGLFSRRRVAPRARSVESPVADRPKTAIILPFPRLRPEPDRDIQLNATWDRLLTRVMDAWVWRVPASFAAIQDCLADLRALVDRDWS